MWAVLFELLTGQRAFQGDSVYEVMAMQLSQEPPHPSAICPDLPKPLAELVLQCLAKDPDQRIQMAERLSEALRSISDRMGHKIG